VSKITIVPHTSGALGYTMYLPDEEKFCETREELAAELHSLLGGMAAEQVVFSTSTTGVSNDLQRATSLARSMVAQFGMSQELGVMAPVVITNRYLDGGAQLDCSQETAAKIDLAVKRLLDEGFATATRVLTENRALLDEIAEYLLLKETITGEELMKFINAAKDPQPAEETAENTEE
jgi:cell division protease FtsH